MENMKIWDALSKTDPKHTKSFKRAGGFSGTAVSPIYMTHKMTEQFGPAGQGWGMGEPLFQTVAGPEGEVLVYCTVSVWWITTEQRVYGVGGDKAVGKNKYGLFTDDEAFKKAYTDALSNAMKQIGMAADIHMGMYDDNKYVNALKEEFSELKAVPISDDQKERLVSLLQDTDTDTKAFLQHFKIDALDNMPAAMFAQAEGLLTKKAKKLDEDAKKEGDA